jgi:enoyl-CoA hydratase/carnithine racemase
MTYNTPQLLLIGAANNLVLTAQDPTVSPLYKCGLADDFTPRGDDLSDSIEEW